LSFPTQQLHIYERDNNEIPDVFATCQNFKAGWTSLSDDTEMLSVKLCNSYVRPIIRCQLS
jgi:hypothetical protein